MTAKTERGKHCEHEIIEAYLKVCNMYGELHKHLGKIKLYQDVADITDFSPHYIGIIVRQYIKGKIRIEKDM